MRYEKLVTRLGPWHRLTDELRQGEGGVRSLGFAFLEPRSHPLQKKALSLSRGDLEDSQPD